MWRLLWRFLSSGTAAQEYAQSEEHLRAEANESAELAASLDAVRQQLLQAESRHFTKERPPDRPNPAEPARLSESGRTRIWDGRPNPAELRFGTAARIRPNSDWGRPPESGRKTYFLIVNDLLGLKI